MGKISSQMAIDDIQGRSVNQGTSAPIAKDWISPRPKIAAITNGVGRTQQTLTKSSDPMKSRNDEAIPMTIATTVTAIKSQARLNWKRGSGNQRRDDRVGEVSGSGMIHSTADEFPRTKQSNHTTRPADLPNNGGLARYQALAVRVAGGAAILSRARAISSCAVSAGLSSAMPCCKRICSSRSTTRQTGNLRLRIHAFCHAVCFGLRAAGKHGDELAVFELGEYVHFAKCLFERGHGGIDHLPSDGAAILAVDDVEVFDLQIQDRQRNAEAMAFGDAPLEHLNKRGAGRRVCSTIVRLSIARERVAPRPAYFVCFGDRNLVLRLYANGRSCGRLSWRCKGRRRLGGSGAGHRHRPGIAKRLSCR